MSDFVQKADVRRSVRTFTTHIADIAALNTLVRGVIDTNAFQTVNPVVAGVTVQGVSHGSPPFGIRVLYEDLTTLKNIGNAIAKTSIVAGYTAAVAAPAGNTALVTAIGRAGQ